MVIKNKLTFAACGWVKRRWGAYQGVGGQGWTVRCAVIRRRLRCVFLIKTRCCSQRMCARRCVRLKQSAANTAFCIAASPLLLMVEQPRRSVFIFFPARAPLHGQKSGKKNGRKPGNAVVTLTTLCAAVSALVALPAFCEKWRSERLLNTVGGRRVPLIASAAVTVFGNFRSFIRDRQAKPSILVAVNHHVGPTRCTSYQGALRLALQSQPPDASTSPIFRVALADSIWYVP